MEQILAVRHEGDRYVFSFPYNPELISVIKQTPGAIYNSASKTWSIPKVYGKSIGFPGQLSQNDFLVKAVGRSHRVDVAIYGPYDPLASVAKPAGLSWNSYMRAFTGMLSNYEYHRLVEALEEIGHVGFAVTGEILPANAPVQPTIPSQAIRLPRNLPYEPWPHQKEGYQFVQNLWQEQHPGALLYWDMGTGKTYTTLLLAMTLKRVVLLAPRSVVPVWAYQAQKHLPGEFAVLSLHKGSVAKRAQALEELLEQDPAHLIVVVNYEAFYRDPLFELLLRHQWDLLVLDESHRIKSPTGKASSKAYELARGIPKRLLLSGTPMPHDPLDIHAQFKVLDPDIYGDNFWKFRRRYAIIGPYKNVVGFRNLEELKAKMAPVTHRVKKEDVLELPPLLHDVVPVELDKERSYYADLIHKHAALIDGDKIDASLIIVLMTKLAQITSGFVMTQDQRVIDVGDTKQNVLKDILLGLDREPAVVFARFLADIDRVKETAKSIGKVALELSGRKDEWVRFQQGEGDVLAVQFQAGSMGVDLTRASYAIVLSQTYSLGDYQQALARLHRAGQKKPVTVYHLIAKGTIDEHVYDALSSKADVIDKTVQGLKEWRRRR